MSLPRLPRLPRTFPPKTRQFAELQETLRLSDGIPKGAELIYMLPKYRANFLSLFDLLCLPTFIASFAFTVGYILWKEFYAEDDEDAEKVVEEPVKFEYYVDEQGVRWKRRKMQSLQTNLKVPESKWAVYLLMFATSFFFLVLRIDNARTVLRIYYHAPMRQYYAVYPRYWKKNRVSPFQTGRVFLAHGKFRILSEEMGPYTLQNKAANRHFRDDEHLAVFVKQKTK